jgi:hypothetical protein
VTVRKEELGRLEFMAEGGYGRVYRVREFTLPKDSTPLAYKEFLESVEDPDQRKRSAEAAKRAVIFRGGVSGPERAVLDKYCTWPRELVADDTGDVIGFLMPLIPDPFFFQQIDVKSGLLANTPRDLGWLIAPEQRRQAAKSNLPDIHESERLYLMAQLVYAIAWLHRRGWVFGDVSFTNAAFTLEPPSLMLFDCDGAAALSDTQRKQPHTPFWVPPEYVGKKDQLQNAQSDVYKLGLAIVRCLKSERGATQTKQVSRIAGILDAEGVALVGRALAKEPADRPSARDLYMYLRQFTAPLLKPPVIAHLALTTPLLLRGAGARLSWQIDNAEDIRIMVGEQREEVSAVKWADHPTGCKFPVAESGRVTITASNPYGRVTRVAGDVMLYEIPPFSVSLDNLPAPPVPEVAAFSLVESVAELTPRLPRMPDIPPLPSAAPYDLMDQLSGSNWHPMPAKRIDDAVQDSAHGIAGVIHVESQRFVAALRAMTQRKHHG